MRLSTLLLLSIAVCTLLLVQNVAAAAAGDEFSDSLESMPNHPLRLQEHKIGVIGAGLAGAAAAHYIREKYGPKVNIIMFDMSPHSRLSATVQPCERPSSCCFLQINLADLTELFSSLRFFRWAWTRSPFAPGARAPISRSFIALM